MTTNGRDSANEGRGAVVDAMGPTLATIFAAADAGVALGQAAPELIAGERRVRACYALALDELALINPLSKAVAHVAEHGFYKLHPDIRSRIGTALPARNSPKCIHCRQVWGKPSQLHELALVDNLQRAELTAYAEAQGSGELDLAHFWAQKCEGCVFHKLGATDPAALCQYQANPSAWDNWDTRVARVWQSGNAPAVPRCRLFRLKTPERTLPGWDAVGGGLDMEVNGVLSLLRQMATMAQGTAYGPHWLDVKRTHPWEPPTWTNAEPYLRKLLPALSPGQRLALVLRWADPFGWDASPVGRGERKAYVPAAGQAYVFTLQREFNR